jgi:hypothetical protein
MEQHTWVPPQGNQGASTFSGLTTGPDRDIYLFWAVSSNQIKTVKKHGRSLSFQVSKNDSFTYSIQVDFYGRN